VAEAAQRNRARCPTPGAVGAARDTVTVAVIRILPGDDVFFVDRLEQAQADELWC